MNLNTRIQHFYDQSTPLWLDVWGEHMHHGYYGADGTQKKERVEAQIDMIETILAWAGVAQASSILDAGCGVGGSARYLAKKYQAKALGLTLSPIQAHHAQQYNERAGLSGDVRIEARDMMTLSKTDGPFDLVWSMESAEHIAEKQAMLNLFYERMETGGKLVLATWCHRESPPKLTAKEQKILDQICKQYHLPPLTPISTLEEMARNSGFKNIQTDDWSKAISPFWKTVIRSALTWQGISGLVKSGMSTIKGAWAMQYMQRGFQMNLLKFGVLSCEK